MQGWTRQVGRLQWQVTRQAGYTVLLSLSLGVFQRQLPTLLRKNTPGLLS